MFESKKKKRLSFFSIIIEFSTVPNDTTAIIGTPPQTSSSVSAETTLISLSSFHIANHLFAYFLIISVLAFSKKERFFL
jgi:hypothetical protein